ncbi:MULTISPECIES: hypothetical protein [Agrobacterium tumefaciens complex]|jgi:hypothetical protein|uniref:hypothetical protein n=1 Tax=Agrobacterium tumefaciens TaxID=358 RepID=UPI000FE299F9|nr:hypothetical protein [Agrobacterium tumefaciens]QAB01155.1 hypothetical protein DC439_25525 [Agrobacterium tumefaciens]
MANPFLRRATEYVRDDASFLAIVSPAPLTTFLAKSEHKDAMFELPVRIIGEPGSGKTMLATLAEFKMVETIMRDLSTENHRGLATALADAGFLQDGRPRVAAVRIPMESDYRDFWELPYEPTVKTKLALWLVQARAMLGLLRNLTANRRRGLDDIRFIARESSEAQIEQIGGLTAQGIRDRALEVQKAIYSIAAGLRPPALENLPIAAISPYQPFEAIRAIEIEWQGETLSLSPLVMLDDVHALHPDQRDDIFAALSRREIRFGRWLMMRLDALSPGAVLGAPGSQETHNLTTGRDFVDIRMQGHSERGAERRQFRSMALDMANRYLPLVQSLKNRNADFAALLPSEAPALAPGRLKELASQIEREQAKLGITAARRQEIDTIVSEHLSGSQSYDKREEVHLSMARILMHRYANRVQHMTPSLFEDFDPDPKSPLKADSGVAEAARFHLSDDWKRAYHYGISDLCDASNENAELFLQFAGALVARMETRVIRGKPPGLNASAQESALVEKARSIMDGWSFAFARRVRLLVDAIAQECLEVSRAPNARLGAGANAIGIPEEDIQDLLRGENELALVLKHALANGAIIVRRNYGQGGRSWCLIELSGTVCLAYGLTFKRGGFLEKRISYLHEVSN